MSPLETRQSLIVRPKSEQNELAWRDFVCAYEGFLNQLVRRQGVPERHVPDVTQQSSADDRTVDRRLER